MRLKSGAEIGCLMLLTVYVLALLGGESTSAWFASPPSPVSPVVSPVRETMREEATPETPASSEAASSFLGPSFWSSPLPWVVVGVPLFGLFAVLLGLLLRRSRSGAP